MATLDQNNSCLCCFDDWIIQQQEDLDELLELLNSTNPENEKLQFVIDKGIQHFQSYIEKRVSLALKRAPSILSPPWCSSFEKCFFWLGGCRPSLSIRLVYTLSGAEFDAQLDEFLKGERKGNLGEITSEQLTSINSLRCKVVEDEDRLSTRMASFQEDIADEPFTKTSNEIGQSSSHQEELDKAMDVHLVTLAEILSEADKLRLKTLKELLLNILTPLQGVELLAATKRLHLSMHQWGQTKGTSRIEAGGN